MQLKYHRECSKALDKSMKTPGTIKLLSTLSLYSSITQIKTFWGAILSISRSNREIFFHAWASINIFSISLLKYQLVYNSRYHSFRDFWHHLRKTAFDKLLLIAFDNGWNKTFAATFANLGGIISKLTAFLC